MSDNWVNTYETVITLNNIGVTLFQHHKCEESMETFKDALDLMRCLFQYDHNSSNSSDMKRRGQMYLKDASLRLARPSPVIVVDAVSTNEEHSSDNSPAVVVVVLHITDIQAGIAIAKQQQQQQQSSSSLSMKEMVYHVMRIDHENYYHVHNGHGHPDDIMDESSHSSTSHSCCSSTSSTSSVNLDIDSAILLYNYGMACYRAGIDMELTRNTSSNNSAVAKRQTKYLQSSMKFFEFSFKLIRTEQDKIMHTKSLSTTSSSSSSSSSMIHYHHPIHCCRNLEVNDAIWEQEIQTIWISMLLTKYMSHVVGKLCTTTTSDHPIFHPPTNTITEQQQQQQGELENSSSSDMYYQEYCILQKVFIESYDLILKNTIYLPVKRRNAAAA